MSAPTLTKRQVQQSVRKGNSRPTVKTALCSPYNIQWPTVQEDIQEEILQRLLSTIKSLEIARPKSRKKKTINTTEEPENNTVIPKTDEQLRNRNQLLFGVNQVTRGLEKDEVRLVISCRSAQPVIITRHLIGLAAVRKCPAICISNLNKSVSKVMNMTSAVAIGFKKTPGVKESSVFDELVEFVAKHAPDIPLPWLPGNSANKSNTEDTIEKMDASVDLSGKHNELETTEPSMKNENPKDVREISKGDGDRAHKDSATFITPHATQTDRGAKEDYSRFYVYKTDTAKSKQNGPEFIKFSSNQEESIDYRNDSMQGHNVEYETVAVKRIPTNTDRKKKKKKFKKI